MTMGRDWCWRTAEVGWGIRRKAWLATVYALRKRTLYGLYGGCRLCESVRGEARGRDRGAHRHWFRYILVWGAGVALAHLARARRSGGVPGAMPGALCPILAAPTVLRPPRLTCPPGAL